MEGSILTPTQKYAAASLFALALHQSQIHLTQPSKSLPSLDKEPVGDGATIGKTVSVSDNPNLWIHESSGLLLPVFRLLGVDDKAWDGLKETAGSSTQVRHHAGALLTLLSEAGESEKSCSERKDKERALSKTVDATALNMEGVSDSSEGIESHDEKSPNGSGHRTSMKSLEEGNRLSYERKVTVLYELLAACVAETDKGGSKSSQSGKGYDARHRVALRLLAAWLDINWTELEAMEILVACSLMDSEKEKDGIDDKDVPSESTWDKMKRGGTVGVAALTGGTLMAVSGGLAAPAITQGLMIVAPALATITTSFYGSVAVAASFGVAGAGLVGTKMARRIGGMEEFEFIEIGDNHKQGRLAVGIMVPGLVLENEDPIKPWEGHMNNLERYLLQWETKNLIVLTTAIQEWLTSKFALQLVKEGAMVAVLSALLSTLALPASLVTASDLIDSKWAIAIDRSDKAGKMLAEVLLKGYQGNRPVTLVGFSLGARVIFRCLQCLAETKGDNGGLVERVVLLGAPVPIKGEKWEDVRQLVPGRFINAYSTSDWTLGITFRASLFSEGLAGIQPVIVPGVENVDITEHIDGHSSYLWKTKHILEKLEIENFYPVLRMPNIIVQEQKIRT
ncbi:hypothetical protein K2173_027955 [Erythroxylum novogranatense]|uniref:Transmembrane and coiled-coil domain-containing protein 4 n=1 Tax=Erythroxylum novogranatense TaxID=1862640 RepID=A0AAV8U342_9ROSI|nr:hypothetical protein K2173_027955 [Erythroxylum novogranatense]